MPLAECVKVLFTRRFAKDENYLSQEQIGILCIRKLLLEKKSFMMIFYLY